jgi:putative ABC transport system substrate-binding protein
MARRGATSVDKVLKSATSSDLPVEQPTAFELVINLKTVQALGLILPHSILIVSTRSSNDPLASI